MTLALRTPPTYFDKFTPMITNRKSTVGLQHLVATSLNTSIINNNRYSLLLLLQVVRIKQIQSAVITARLCCIMCCIISLIIHEHLAPRHLY